jgi:hypothetical protein
LDQLGQAVDVAGGEDVLDVGPQVLIDRDSSRAAYDRGGVEVEAPEVGGPADGGEGGLRCCVFGGAAPSEMDDDLLLEASPQNLRYRITCLTGVSPAGAEAIIDPGLLNRNMVLHNSVLFGSVNANRHHYELAAQALTRADPGWLADLMTREVPLDRWADAYAREPDDIKTVLNFPGGLP